MTLATLEFPNGSRLDFDDGHWSGEDASLVAKANAFFPSPQYIPKSFSNPAVAVAGLATELAAKLGAKIVFTYSLDSTSARPRVADENPEKPAVILASVEFSSGVQIHFGGNGRWTGDDAVFVAMANAYERSPDYNPDYVKGVATEVADVLGGEVIYVKKLRSKMPPGTIY